MKPKVAFIGIGTNLGDRFAQLRRALECLQADPGILRVRVSRVYETEPVGDPTQPWYLNAVAEVKTLYAPQDLLKRCLELERQAGRQRTTPGEARTLDLDLLAYEHYHLETPQLVLPHPRMHQRAFVLIPLAELAPHWRHPLVGKTVEEMVQQLEDPHQVYVYKNPNPLETVSPG